MVKTNCTQSMSNELGRISQGNYDGFKANDRVNFINNRENPNDRKVNYAIFLCVIHDLLKVIRIEYVWYQEETNWTMP